MRERLVCPEPMRGDHVEVVKGRKVPVGLKGVLGWIGEVSRGRYGYGSVMRAGVDPEGGGERVWIDYTNLVNHSWEERYEVYRAKVEVVEAEKAAKKKAEAEYVAKVLDLSVSKCLGCVGMSGWRDEYKHEVGLRDASLSDEEIVKAVHLAYPSQSSWGALRWRAGVHGIAVHRDRMVVEYVESIGLAD